MSPRHRWTAPLLLGLSLSLVLPLSASASPPSGQATTSLTAAEDSSGDNADTAPVPLEDITVSTEQIAFGLRRPTSIATPEDGTNRLFITEKLGTVRVYRPDTGLATEPLLDISDVVDASGNERGLLGIATAADFAETQELYLAYTALPDGAVTLARYRLDSGELQDLLAQEHAEYNNHNGGQLAFGPDGHLYWSIGDGGGSGDPFNAGQRLDTLLGKILRLDVSADCDGLGYCVPEDNPFAGVEGAREEIWHYGLRNPWRFSFDSADGSMWIADVGQGRWEEVNHLAPGEGGHNLGWSCYEGLEVFDPDQCLDEEEYTDPVFTYPLTGGNCAVIGGHVYRQEEFAHLMEGTYVLADYCSYRTWAIREDGDGGYLTAQIGEMPTQVTAFGITSDGDWYVVNDLPGGLHRVSFEGPEQEEPGTCHVDYRPQIWGTGMTADITLTNTGPDPVSGWSLAFSLPSGHTLVSGWNAVFTLTDGLATAANVSHNETIAPGESVTIGFLTSHSGDTTPPTRFSLNGDTCTTGS
ncbi:hypothetical protein GCM10009716_46260 [Streptomyces sodiiphilus]|uniref:CBM2 domain-containing protein n=1 Tax=Streptomyces sodiiphilus TaxID=226217 RepID=A0ABN2PVH2_9ACTN